MVIALHGWARALRLGLRWSYAWLAGRKTRELEQTVLGEELAALCERLGPVFVKLGQLLSTRPDLLPAAVLAPLARLQDGLAPAPWHRVRRELERAFGEELSRHFAAIEPLPLAAASMAQVHRARLAGTGRAVVLKVRRPGIARVMARDLALLAHLSRWAARRRWARDLPIETAIDQLSRALAAQIDLGLEGENAGVVSEGLAGLPGVHVPAVLLEPSRQGHRDGVLVLELCESLQRLDDPALAPERARAAVEELLAALYTMIFTLGRVHCDLHPGNVFLQGERVVVLDFGFVAHLSARERAEFRDFFLGIVHGDGRQCARILRRTAEWVRPGFDELAFETAVSALVRRTAGLKAAEFSVAGFVSELFALLRRHGVCGSSGFTATILALLVFEGFARRWYPELDFQRAAEPYVARSIIEAVGLF